MTPDERRAKMREILDQHDQLARRMGDSSGAFDHALEATRALLVAVREANEANRAAIAAMIAANRAALALWNDNGDAP